MARSRLTGNNIGLERRHRYLRNRHWLKVGVDHPRGSFYGTEMRNLSYVIYDDIFCVAIKNAHTCVAMTPVVCRLCLPLCRQAQMLVYRLVSFGFAFQGLTKRGATAL